MAISLLNGNIANNYCGLSSDQKPSNLTFGTLFTELDTLKTYIYTANGWIDYLSFKRVMISQDIDIALLLGAFFNFSTIESNLGFGDKIIYRMLTGENKHVYYNNITISAEGATIKATFYKDINLTNGGDEQTNVIHNLNDESSNTPETKIYKSVVGNLIQYTGTAWKTIVIYGNTSALSVTSGSTKDLAINEFITKKEENYILEIENIDENEDTAHHINIIATIAERNDASYGV